MSAICSSAPTWYRSAPKVVIASGACAISGGPFYGSPEIVGDLGAIVPVDLYIPACRPHPLTTLHALLQFLNEN